MNEKEFQRRNKMKKDIKWQKKEMNEEFIKSQIKWNTATIHKWKEKYWRRWSRHHWDHTVCVDFFAHRHFYFLILYQRSININIFSHICIVNRKYCFQYEHLTDLKFSTRYSDQALKKNFGIAKLPNEFLYVLTWGFVILACEL